MDANEAEMSDWDILGQIDTKHGKSSTCQYKQVKIYSQLTQECQIWT